MSRASWSDCSRVFTVLHSPRASDAWDSSTTAQEFKAPPLALFPENKRLLQGFFGPVEAAAGDRVADQGLPIGRELYFHGPNRGGLGGAC